jgi:hypothetical protein
VLHIDYQVMTKLIQLVGGYARLDEWRNVIEYFAGQTTRDAHFLDFF